MKDVAVIIPAAGAGRRFGAGHNKIFEPLAGEAIFLRTLALFTQRQDVCQIQIVCSQEDMPRLRSEFSDRLDRLGVQLTLGGQVRSQSVRNALAALDERATLICVHDAVRPCLSGRHIDAVFDQGRRSGAAILAYPVHGTLKLVDEAGRIEQTLPRQPLWEAQTPQVFERGLLLRAYEGQASATDDAHLVEQLGHPVSVVLGDPRNIKITTTADLHLAEAVWPSLGNPA